MRVAMYYKGMKNTQYLITNRTANSPQAVCSGHPHPYLSLGCNTSERGATVEWVEYPINASKFGEGEAAGILLMLPIGCMMLNEGRTFWAKAQRELGMR
jgi:hypothetical protein